MSKEISLYGGLELKVEYGEGPVAFFLSEKKEFAVAQKV